MKKNICKFAALCFAVLLSFAFLPVSMKKAAASELSPDFVAAKSAYLCDFDSKTLIYAKNENERKPIASMTKIMLLLLAFEKEAAGEFSLDEDITVSENASGMGGSQVFLEAGGIYKASELIKSIIVSSANDSSVAIAERLYGSEDIAVDAMNERAKELCLNDTLFSNCTGLTRPTQYSSAKDVAIMLSELVKFYNGCDGGKTGFTNEAGFCLAATAKRGTTRLIGVVIGEADSKKRFGDCSSLLDYGFNNFTSKCVLTNNEASDYQAEVSGGKKGFVSVAPEENVYVFGRKNEKENIKIHCILNDDIKAPLKKGDVIGKFIVYKDNVKFAEKNAVCFEGVERKTYGDYLKEITEY